MGTKVVVADSDALIALILETDPHHSKAYSINENLSETGVSIIFPQTVFPEAMTTLKRSLDQPQKAHLINRQLSSNFFEVLYINERIMDRACQIFDQAISKKNTFFDALVAASAEYLDADSIFSFDKWYEKLGFKLTQI